MIAVALLAAQRIDTEIASLKDQLAITYQSQCVAGTLAVTFDAKAIDDRAIARNTARLGAAVAM